MAIEFGDGANPQDRIDAHQHFWSVARNDYGWLTPASGVLYRDYGPGDLSVHLAQHNIGSTILVQAAQTVAETQFLLGIAKRVPFVAGVVGWVDMSAAGAGRTIETLARDPLLVGLRPMVQDLDDDDWLLRRDLMPAIQAMSAAGLVFDALIYPRHLSRLAAFLDRYPDLPVVVDHAAKPAIRSGVIDPWRADIAAVAARPRTLCKISGLVTEAADGWNVEDLRPYIEHLCAAFGPSRLMWGSDWPVVERAGGYDAWCSASMTLLGGFTPEEAAAVFGGNARQFYLEHRGRGK